MGELYVFVIHQVILIPQMMANLLCPMQLRDNDPRFNDEPKFMVLNLMDDHNSIVIPAITFMIRLNQPISCAILV